MKRKYIKGLVLLGVVLSIGLASCRVGKNYKAPEVDSKDLYRESVESDTTSVANIPWRTYFSDPLLQALIDEGINNNFDLQIAVTRITQAEAGLQIARAAYFPYVSLVGQVNHNISSADKNGNNKNILGYNSTRYSLGIATSWEADIWGKLNRQSKANYAKFLASQSYHNLIKTSLVSNIATIYYSLLALDEQLYVTKTVIDLQKQNTNTIEAMMQAGMLTGAAVEQSKAQLYGTQITVPELQNQIRQLENQLCVLLGRKPGTIARTTFQDQTVPAQLKYGVPAQMLAQRPDVQLAELNFRSAFELTNVARANFYPSLTLGTGSMIGLGANSLSNFFKPENIFASILGGLTQPLFARRQISGQLKISKAQEQEALLSFEQTVLEAGQEVSDILFEFEASVSKNELRSKQVESMQKTVYYTQELLKAGEVNYLEVLTAEQTLLQAKLGQVSDKLEQLQASVNLYRALGGGLE